MPILKSFGFIDETFKNLASGGLEAGYSALSLNI